MKIPFYRTQAFHQQYLKFTAFVVGSFGPIFFLGTMIDFSEPARWTLDLLAWPLDGAQTYAAPTTRFLSALTGGFLLGWGMTILFLANGVYEKAPNQVRKAILGGILCWFFLDSLGSITSGNASNAFFNTIILLLGVGPLWWPAIEE